MVELIDITGQKIRNWTVLHRDLSKEAYKPYWLCQCECGARKSLAGHILRKPDGYLYICKCRGLKRKIPTGSHNFIDLTGQVFGRLTVLRRLENTKRDEPQWECLCACGNIKVVTSPLLRSGGTSSCGCLKKEIGREKVSLLAASNYGKVRNISGQTFGLLTAISLSPDRAHNGRPQHLFRCACGKEKVIQTTSVTTGNTRSCGCINENRRGPAHPQWKGNKTLNGRLRVSKEYLYWRDAVYARDRFTCTICSTKSTYKNPLHAHHIIELSTILNKYHIKTIEEAMKCELLWDISNGITVCVSCHEDIHGWKIPRAARKRRRKSSPRRSR